MNLKFWTWGRKPVHNSLHDQNDVITIAQQTARVLDPTMDEPVKALDVSSIQEPVDMREPSEMVANDIVQQIIDHGFQKLGDSFSPPQDSFTKRHHAVFTAVIRSLKEREAALLQEIANRQQDLLEVQYGIYGYEMGIEGFNGLLNPKPAPVEVPTVEESEQMVETSVAALEQEAANVDEVAAEATPEEQVDDPRLPETESKVIPDQEKAQAQAPIHLDTLRGKKKSQQG